MAHHRLFLSAASCGLLLASVSAAQAPPGPPPGPGGPPATLSSMIARLDQQPGAADLTRIAGALRKSAGVGDAAKAEADALIAQAGVLQKANQTGEARRDLLHAVTLLRGQAWTADSAYGAAVIVRPAAKIADLSKPVAGTLSLDFPAPFPPAEKLTLRLSLKPAGGADIAAAPVLATYQFLLRDLIDQPFAFDLDAKAMAEGSYLLTAEVFDGDTQIAHVAAPVQLIRDLGLREVKIEQSLTKIQGHDDAKADVLYPFDLASVINAGRRDVALDFPAAIKQSEQLADLLASGQDPVFRAKGSQRRHYYFVQGGEIMPYKLYVPSNWNGVTQLPLVVALHAGGGTEDGADVNGILSQEAEKRGWILVTPLGYRPGGDSGNIYPFPAIQQPPPDANDPDHPRVHALSEIDTMNVVELVAKEYNVDRSRIYLMGNSGGGQGTYFLASKYPQEWAAIAPSDGPVDARVYPFDKLKPLGAAMIIHGELDNFAPLEGSRAMYQGMKDHGVDATLVIVKGGGHPDAWQKIVPETFDFFAAHKRGGG